MIRQIVILHFKKSSIDYLALLEKTRPFLKQIPGILSYQLFRNDSKYVPEDVISIGAEIHFKDQHALDIFMDHPKHYEASAIFEQYLADPAFMVLSHTI